MTRSEFDAFCRTLPAASHVVQWGGASVWKVGGRIFAVCSNWGAGASDAIAFKASDLSYQLLCQEPGIVSAPYLGRAKWVQLRGRKALSAKELKAYLVEAHRLVAAKLTRKARAELGLAVVAPGPRCLVPEIDGLDRV